jgi:hypothetical protein
MNAPESPNHREDFRDSALTPADRAARTWRNAHLRTQLLAYMFLLIWLLGPGFW